MTNSILKYELSFPGETTVFLPTNSSGQVSILSVEVQDQRNIVLYVVTDLDVNSCEHKEGLFYCVETGIDKLPNPDPEHMWNFLKTCMLGDSSYVIHVFVHV